MCVNGEERRGRGRIRMSTHEYSVGSKEGQEKKKLISKAHIR